MAAIPALGGTWIVTLECLGTLPGPRFLDGRTHDGRVGLANAAAPPFTGTRWALTTLTGGIVMLKCLGSLEGPRFLDGRTHNQTVGLAPFITPPFSGARWAAEEVSPGVLTFKCMGEIEGPRFLDGRTQGGTVGLAPSTAGQFTGTRWRVHLEGELVTLECLGGLPGVRFLDGRTHDGTVGLAPTTADPFTGTLWELSAVQGGVNLKCLGSIEGPRFLDGRTHNGSVGLAPSTAPPFTGTRWQVVNLPGGAVALRCLGAIEGPRFLDGRTHDGSAGLAATTDPPFTGTRWCIASPSIVMGALQPGTEDALAVHAALFANGKVLYFGGDEHDRGQHDQNQIDHTRTFDSHTFLIRRAPSPSTDVFCCGHATLADGRLLVAGGTEVFLETDPQDHHHDHFPGLHDCWIFDPATEAWTKVASMVSAPLETFRDNSAPGPGNPGGRWYPTLVTLGNGEVLAMSGHPSVHDVRHNHHMPERFNPASPLGSWTLLQAASAAFEVTGEPKVYPRAHLLPNGMVFCSTPLGTTPQSQLIDPFSGVRTFGGAAPPDPLNIGNFFSQDGASVLLPLLPAAGYRARILLCGAAQPVVMHLGGANPVWQPTAPRQLPAAPPRFDTPNPPRFHVNAILLPTGDVFVCGGCAVFRSDKNAVLESEIYHPPVETATGPPPGQEDHERWEYLPAAVVPRNYHSVALLLPDGRVWTAGSNHDGQQGRQNLEPRIEILNPPYVGKPGRPVIDEAAASISLGQSFTVRTRQAAAISQVAILRVGSVTHAFHSDQRYIGLTFSPQAAELLTVQPPPDHNIAPPGIYLLFIIDRDRLPSEGRFIRLL